ncbi:MAG: protein kinase [Planctomycetota bacterium]
MVAPEPAPDEPPDGSRPEWPVVDFLLRMRADQEGAGVRPLREYLDLYPAHQEAVAREYLLIRSLDRDAATDDDDPRSFGGFRLLRQLGQGGQGTVWLAHEQATARAVALKILHRRGNDELAEARLLREAALAGRFGHPGLARVLGAGRDEGRLWIASDHVPGEPLSGVLAQRRLRGEPMPLPAAARLVGELARALHHAHGFGVVHRDVKPANVIVRPDGAPVLTDFGLSRETQAGQDRGELTLSGELRGTPAYLAPERIHGGPATARADVWALGALLFECLRLESPFAAPTVAATLQALARREVWSLPGYGALPADARAVLAMAMAREPARRYATAAALALDCDRLARGEAPLARRPGVARRLLGFARNEPALAAASAVAVLLLAAGLLSALWFLGRERELRAALETREQRVRTVARSLLYDLHTAVRNLPGAVELRQRMLERARDALQELHGAAPDDPQLRRDLITAWVRLGDVLGHSGVANRGDTEAADRCYRAAVDLARAGIDRGDPACRAELGTALVRRGDLRIDFRDEARALYEQALALLGEDDAMQRAQRATVLCVMAQFDRDEGALDLALQRCAESERLFAADVDQDGAREAERIGVRLVRATILLQRGDAEAARSLLRAQQAHIAAVRAERPLDVQLLARDAKNEVYLGRAEAELGDRAAALAAIERAVALRRERVAADAADLGARHELGLALVDRANRLVTGPTPDLEQIERDLTEAAACVDAAGFAEFAAALRRQCAELAR